MLEAKPRKEAALVVERVRDAGKEQHIEGGKAAIQPKRGAFGQRLRGRELGGIRVQYPVQGNERVPDAANPGGNRIGQMGEQRKNSALRASWAGRLFGGAIRLTCVRGRRAYGNGFLQTRPRHGSDRGARLKGRLQVSCTRIATLGVQRAGLGDDAPEVAGNRRVGIVDQPVVV